MTEAFYQYQYRYGDRPLAGYTIQRAVGRGGFGEVYFAISDSGRQVALKAILNHEQIELRGIRQCMNLKCARSWLPSSMSGIMIKAGLL